MGAVDTTSVADAAGRAQVFRRRRGELERVVAERTATAERLDEEIFVTREQLLRRDPSADTDAAVFELVAEREACVAALRTAEADLAAIAAPLADAELAEEREAYERLLEPVRACQERILARRDEACAAFGPLVEAWDGLAVEVAELVALRRRARDEFPHTWREDDLGVPFDPLPANLPALLVHLWETASSEEHAAAAQKRGALRAQLPDLRPHRRQSVIANGQAQKFIGLRFT
jgi:hypothetical protein